MLRFKEGDRVRLVDRVPTPSDVKSGLYYGFYRNLAGTIFKLYGSGEGAQAAVEVDIATLPEEVAVRHLETRDRMRSQLTGEAKRASAPGGEAEFHLRYVILVALTDLKAPLPLAKAQAVNGNGKRLAA
ncbi:MAG TPA: hypothetical protein VKU00_17350 [Chthonomonadaceae bacterium]|nr:hypothetical protein [Chthonomonadaceae bacterium]